MSSAPYQRSKNVAVAHGATLQEQFMGQWHIVKTAFARQDHSLTAHSTVLPPCQQSKIAAVAHGAMLQEQFMGQCGGPSEDHNLHPDHWTDHLKQNHARMQKKTQ